MSIYLTETDFVRALADEFRRAANAADEIASDVALAIGLSGLESAATVDAISLSERLGRAAADLRTQSFEMDDLFSAKVAPSSAIRTFREPRPHVATYP